MYLRDTEALLYRSNHGPPGLSTQQFTCFPGYITVHSDLCPWQVTWTSHYYIICTICLILAHVPWKNSMDSLLHYHVTCLLLQQPPLIDSIPSLIDSIPSPRGSTQLLDTAAHSVYNIILLAVRCSITKEIMPKVKRRSRATLKEEETLITTFQENG
jgi:hypothetical protein